MNVILLYIFALFAGWWFKRRQPQPPQQSAAAEEPAAPTANDDNNDDASTLEPGVVYKWLQWHVYLLPTRQALLFWLNTKVALKFDIHADEWLSVLINNRMDVHFVCWHLPAADCQSEDNSNIYRAIVGCQGWPGRDANHFVKGNTGKHHSHWKLGFLLPIGRNRDD